MLLPLSWRTETALPWLLAIGEGKGEAKAKDVEDTEDAEMCEKVDFRAASYTRTEDIQSS